ncbi:MAG: exodeoxyribonuclease VII large subunit [Verrucomicrobiales bacterium]|nr:exodeoxyribonuclease VII large subunit [Verrucomicrobiales bacterium]
MPQQEQTTDQNVLTVTQLTREIRESLEGRFSGLWIEGEVSNLRKPASGHQYFTLKDAGAQLACVLFRGQARFNTVEIADGQQIQVFGDVSVYESRGQYQLVAQWVQPKGFGALQTKFEALKRKLEEEGLFELDRKKPIPRFPGTIAVVTSATGAAVRDILNVIQRRAPWVRACICPVKVQGEGAAVEIAEAIRWISSGPDSLPTIDTLLVARGGGSLEDLWSFNEEVVARAVADCPIPVISGVGHEIDFTICDFVADRREPTPSAAAEFAVPDGPGILRSLENLQGTLENQVSGQMDQYTRSLEFAFRAFEARSPEGHIQNAMQSLDFLQEQLSAVGKDFLNLQEVFLSDLGRQIERLSPESRLDLFQRDLDHLIGDLNQVPDRLLTQLSDRLEARREMVDLLDPKAVLSRGFSMTFDKAGNPLASGKSVSAGDRVRTVLSDGEFESVVD